jgi:hypothetical protein
VKAPAALLFLVVFRYYALKPCSLHHSSTPPLIRAAAGAAQRKSRWREEVKTPRKKAAFVQVYRAALFDSTHKSCKFKFEREGGGRRWQLAGGGAGLPAVQELTWQRLGGGRGMRGKARRLDCHE